MMKLFSKDRSGRHASALDNGVFPVASPAEIRWPPAFWFVYTADWRSSWITPIT